MADGMCSVAECDRARYARGWCNTHYKRWRRHGTVFEDVPIGRGGPLPCSVEGCKGDAEGRGLCHGHLQRVLRTGDVRADEPLRRRKQPETCTVVTDDEPCMQSAKAAGLCGTHYARARKHGDPLPDVPIRIVTGEGSLSHGYWKVPVPEELRHLTDGEPAWVSTGW